MENIWDRLERVLAEAVRCQLPLEGVKVLVDGLRALTGSETAVLYLLQLDQGKFVPRIGDSTQVVDGAESISVDVLEASDAPTFLEAALQKREMISRVVSFNGFAFFQLAVPLKRATSCLGLLILQRSGHETFTHEERSIPAVLANTIVTLVEKQSSLRLLEAVQEPINFHQSLNDYLQDLLLLVAGASGMPMIAIRELDRDAHALRCIATYGIDGELSDADLKPYEQYAPFLKAIDEKKPVSVSDVTRDGGLSDLLDRPQLVKVRSFVVAPILVGDTDNVFGTLSFAALTRFTYSHLETAGFETIANVIGTSITNYRNSQTVNQLFLVEGEIAVGLTALEVAQAARHEARNVVDSITTELATLTGLLNKPRDNALRITESLHRLFDNSQMINHALDKIRNVSRPPDRELAYGSLKQIINEAAALVNGKIAKERVLLRVEGPDMEIEAYPERLRHAFLNLFLNSLDAFGIRKKESNRNITVSIDNRPSSDGGEVAIRYIDNATGVDMTKLKNIPSTLEGPVKVDVIFHPGVTSKATGSGHGLFLVRRIVGEHKGSIDLVDHKNGVVFDIRLPKRFTLRPSKVKEGT